MKIKSENDRYRDSLQDMHTSLGPPVSSAESPISSFYDGKSIFITGATGFMGKVFWKLFLLILRNVIILYCLPRFYLKSCFVRAVAWKIFLFCFEARKVSSQRFDLMNLLTLRFVCFWFNRLFCRFWDSFFQKLIFKK